MENREKSDLYDKLIDLELAKNNNYPSAKRHLSSIALMVSFYYSFLLSLGIVLGYIGTKIFSKFFLEEGKVNCIFLDFGKWKIHMHHWILGTLFLSFLWILDFFYLPKLFLGVVLGIILHDIYDYNDWYKILIKEEERVQ